MQFDYRIYWEDTDAGGIVYHANYLKLAERARTDWLRELGYGQRQLHSAMGGAFVVKRCNINYHAPAFLDDMVTVHTALQHSGAVRLELQQRVKRADILLADLAVELVYLQHGKPARMPNELQQIFGESLAAALPPAK